MLLISPQKLFPFSRYLSFCLDFLVMYQSSLVKKITSNFMTSPLGQQTVVIYIFPNISRSKGKQTMKFGQLIECNMRNIFRIIFEEKYFSCFILLIDQISLSGCLSFVRYWAICLRMKCHCDYVNCDVTNFEVNLIFLIKPFFLHEQKVLTKTKIS